MIEAIRHAVLVAGLCALALVALAWLVPKWWRAVRRLAECGWAFLALFVFMWHVGATKSIRWDAGLTNNGTLITNDTVEVRWTYSGIPAASTVYIDIRPEGTTNEWQTLGETTAAAGQWLGTLANATNYDYWVYSTYVPPVPVHTNGVWVNQGYETKERRGAAAFLIINGRIDSHGRPIAPPSARKNL